MLKRLVNESINVIVDASENESELESGSGSGDWHDEEENRDVKSYFIPLCVLAVVIVMVNSCILVLVWRNVKLRSNCNALLVSLAVADGSTGLVGIPLFVIFHFVADKLTIREQCFMILSQFTWFWFMSIVSIFHLLVIACEQYLAILKPFSHDKIVTKTSTGITLAVIWLTGIGHSFLPWTWTLRDGDEFCYVEDEYSRKIYTIVSVAVFYCVPIAMLFFVYYRIVSEAKRQLGRIKRDSVCSKGKYSNLSSCTRYRGFYIIALMWVVFILCWTPYFGSVFYEAFQGPIESFWLSYYMSIQRFVPSLLNPIMFAFWRSDFRAACIKKFCCCVIADDRTRSVLSSGKQQLPLINKENRLSDSKDSKPQSV